VNGKCALCARDAELQVGHIIPKFVFSWLKETAPGGIRSNRVPNRRIQDGEKQYLLCSDCEELFSRWETTFCERLFLPLHSSSSVSNPVRYGPWALKFAVSVSWRVLLYYLQLGMSHFSEEHRETAREALNVWRGFLLEEQPHPGQFEQHLLPVDVIKRYSGPAISPFMNRYLLRSVHMDVLCSDTSAIVYTKMCRLVLFGFIQQGNSHHWKGTKLHVKSGLVAARDYVVPGEIADYMNEKADHSAKILASLSPRQKQMIHEMIMDNAGELANSEVFRAMYYDVAHSGRDAFGVTESDQDRGQEM